METANHFTLQSLRFQGLRRVYPEIKTHQLVSPCFYLGHRTFHKNLLIPLYDAVLGMYLSVHDLLPDLAIYQLQEHLRRRYLYFNNSHYRHNRLSSYFYNCLGKPSRAICSLSTPHDQASVVLCYLGASGRPKIMHYIDLSMFLRNIPLLLSLKLYVNAIL